ncbi:hypothetical protein ACLB2K_031331 [Fragaria x ananassa]
MFPLYARHDLGQASILRAGNFLLFLNSGLTVMSLTLIMKIRILIPLLIDMHINIRCPDLKALALPRLVQTFNLNRILEIIGNWKYLETLFMPDSFGMEKILSQISICCKIFSCLHMFNTRISEDEAMAIVSHLPKLKQLSLINAHIGRDNLVKLLKGCKDLVLLDVRDCVGFDEGDAEILKLASHITKFRCEGSKSADKYYTDNYEGYGESELSDDMHDFSEDEYGYYEDISASG